MHLQELAIALLTILHILSYKYIALYDKKTIDAKH